MNWLAHIFISVNHIDYQLGNLLADPLKGKCWDGASEELQSGMRMHGSIDSFTDSNVTVSKSKARLGKKGYLKGVIIDITYDHLLIKNWDLYSNICLSEFINEFYDRALIAVNNYPEKPELIVKRLVASKNLTSYGTFDGLEAAFSRIDKRLSPRVLKKESARNYISIVEREIAGIEQDFLAFFPVLIQHFKNTTKFDGSHHWLK